MVSKKAIKYGKKGKKAVKEKKTRKELRKDKRKEKKTLRAFYHENRKMALQPGKFVLNTEKTAEKPKSKKKKSKVERELDNEKKEEAKLKKEMENSRKRKFEEDDVYDDKLIKNLERKLKLNKRKSKNTPKSFAEDGLDYVLDICDEENRKIAMETEKQILGAESDSENETENSPTSQKMEEADFSDDDFSGDEEAENFDEESENESEFEEEIGEESDGEIEENVEEIDRENEEIDEENPDKTWEDIYGRKRDAKGLVVSDTSGKYVPPAARLKSISENSAKSEKLLRLKRQLKGLLNRLSEHNMHSIVTQVEEMYGSNARNDMNELLAILLKEALVSPIMQPERLIMEHVMLVAILSANVGTEIGAHFLQYFVKLFDEMSRMVQEVENKELDSVILIISHLYNFKVVGAKLLYEILERIAEKFTEKEIELILLILKTVGFCLRKDDPRSLKTLILNLQQRAKDSESKNLRVKFMMETLLAIKDNKVNKIPNYDPSYSEHLKKLLKSFLRRGNSVSPFEICLDDLLKAEERGRWWIVGSAWTGKEDKKPALNEEKEVSFSKTLLDLARKQRMNTDARRNIFCTLLSAEDYLDAFEKINRLDLKGQQAREIVYVVLDCCLQEKNFNPFYAVVAQKFCEFDRKYKIAMQYAVWDKIKLLENYAGNQILNFSKFLSHLLLEDGVSLSILKVVELGELDKRRMKFLRYIILEILLQDSEEACLNTFEKIALSSQLKQFREGLKLFIDHFLLKNTKKDVIPEEKRDLFEKRAGKASAILVSRGSKIMF